MTPRQAAARRNIRLAHERLRAKGSAHRSAVVDDFLELVESGETHRETIAARMGYGSWKSLLRMLQRGGLRTNHPEPSRDGVSLYELYVLHGQRVET